MAKRPNGKAKRLKTMQRVWDNKWDKEL